MYHHKKVQKWAKILISEKLQSKCYEQKLVLCAAPDNSSAPLSLNIASMSGNYKTSNLSLKLAIYLWLNRVIIGM